MSNNAKLVTNGLMKALLLCRPRIYQRRPFQCLIHSNLTSIRYLYLNKIHMMFEMNLANLTNQCKIH